MRYDLVVSDFDGTLRRNDDTISSRTVAAVRAFTENGGTFAVSTGRGYRSIAKRLGELGIVDDVPVLSCHGALMRGAKSGQTWHEIGMPAESAAAFLQRAESLGLTCQYYTADNIYAPAPNDVNAFYFERVRTQPVWTHCKASESVQSANAPVLKVLCFIEPSARADMLRAFRSLPHLKTFASHPRLIEAVSENAGKGNGLIRACEHLGIAAARSAAVGDELNDIEMLQAAGLGVAMGNAVAEVKAAADCITEDCDADGVAVLLEKIMREQL